MEHVLVYHGKISSLALMQEEYGELYIPAINQLGEEMAGAYINPPFFPTQFKEYIEYLRKNKSKEQVFAILKHENVNEVASYRYVGQVGIHSMKWPDGVGITGFLIIDPSCHRIGIGTEAQLNMLYHGFNRLGLRKITANAKAFNGNSLGCLLKCGYKICGSYSRHVHHNGSYVDEILLEVFPENFRPVWERYKATGELPKLTSEQRDVLEKRT